MNNYKVGDKVLYNGEVQTVTKIPNPKLTKEDVGYVDKDYVELDLWFDNAIHHTDIEPYYTPHQKLLMLGWNMVDTGVNYIMYDKFDELYSRHTMSIKINKDKDGWYFTSHGTFFDKELTTILLEFLEEVEKDLKEEAR